MISNSMWHQYKKEKNVSIVHDDQRFLMRPMQLQDITKILSGNLDHSGTQYDESV